MTAPMMDLATVAETRTPSWSVLLFVTSSFLLSVWCATFVWVGGFGLLSCRVTVCPACPLFPYALFRFIVAQPPLIYTPFTAVSDYRPLSSAERSRSTTHTPTKMGRAHMGTCITRQGSYTSNVADGTG